MKIIIKCINLFTIVSIIIKNDKINKTHRSVKDAIQTDMKIVWLH